MDNHWNYATDKKFIKKIYDQIDFFYGTEKAIKILDLGVEYYNSDCQSFIKNKNIKYWQLEPFRTSDKNDGFFHCKVEECLEKYPGNESEFDMILDFGVLGWNGIQFSQSEQEKYTNNIFKLLKPGGHYILHGDRVETKPEYIINVDKFIRPKFSQVEIMGFNSLEIITCPNHGTIWDITFWKTNEV